MRRVPLAPCEVLLTCARVHVHCYAKHTAFSALPTLMRWSHGQGGHQSTGLHTECVPLLRSVASLAH